MIDPEQREVPCAGCTTPTVAALHMSQAVCWDCLGIAGLIEQEDGYHPWLSESAKAAGLVTEEDCVYEWLDRERRRLARSGFKSRELELF